MLRFCLLHNTRFHSVIRNMSHPEGTITIKYSRICEQFNLAYPPNQRLYRLSIHEYDAILDLYYTSIGPKLLWTKLFQDMNKTMQSPRPLHLQMLRDPDVIVTCMIRVNIIRFTDERRNNNYFERRDVIVRCVVLPDNDENVTCTSCISNLYRFRMLKMVYTKSKDVVGWIPHPLISGSFESNNSLVLKHTNLQGRYCELTGTCIFTDLPIHPYCWPRLGGPGGPGLRWVHKRDGPVLQYYEDIHAPLSSGSPFCFHVRAIQRYFKIRCPPERDTRYIYFMYLYRTNDESIMDMNSSVFRIRLYIQEISRYRGRYKRSTHTTRKHSLNLARFLWYMERVR